MSLLRGLLSSESIILDVAVVSRCERVHQPVPHPRPSPAHEVVVARGPRPIALGQVAPRRSRAQHPEDAIQHLSVIDTRHASRLMGRSGSITRHSKSVRSYRLMPILNQKTTLVGIPSMDSRLGSTTSVIPPPKLWWLGRFPSLGRRRGVSSCGRDRHARLNPGYSCWFADQAGERSSLKCQQQ